MTRYKIDGITGLMPPEMERGEEESRLVRLSRHFVSHLRQGATRAVRIHPARPIDFLRAVSRLDSVWEAKASKASPKAFRDRKGAGQHAYYARTAVPCLDFQVRELVE
jgi:hypothetical protein